MDSPFGERRSPVSRLNEVANRSLTRTVRERTAQGVGCCSRAGLGSVGAGQRNGTALDESGIQPRLSAAQLAVAVVAPRVRLDALGIDGAGAGEVAQSP